MRSVKYGLDALKMITVAIEALYDDILSVSMCRFARLIEATVGT